MATLPDSTRTAKGSKVGKHRRRPRDTGVLSAKWSGPPDGEAPPKRGVYLATNDAGETSHPLRSAIRSSARAKPSKRTQGLPGEERISVSGVWLILSPRYAPKACCTATMSANLPV